MTFPASSDLRRKAAFLVAGTTGFALYYLFSLGLDRVPGVRAEIAASVAALLAIPPTFLLQKRFAFRHVGDATASFAKYCVLQGFNALGIGVLARAGRHAGLPAEINFLVSGAFVVIVSYLVLTHIVFRQAGNAGRGG